MDQDFVTCEYEGCYDRFWTEEERRDQDMEEGGWLAVAEEDDHRADQEEAVSRDLLGALS